MWGVNEASGGVNRAPLSAEEAGALLCVRVASCGEKLHLVGFGDWDLEDHIQEQHRHPNYSCHH